MVLAARNEDELQETAAGVRSKGAEALVCAVDLREAQAAEALVGKTLDCFGRIDALLNIAGAVPQIDLFQMTIAQWEDGMALKFHGARRRTIRAWDALKESGGSVVLISGSAALDPNPGFAAVASINAAIIALAKAFAEQGIKDGVQVNSVVPGVVMTGRRQSFFEKWAPAHGLTVEEAMKMFPGLVSAASANRKRLLIYGLYGVTCSEVDDGKFSADGWCRSQRHLSANLGHRAISQTAGVNMQTRLDHQSRSHARGQNNSNCNGHCTTMKLRHAAMTLHAR